MSVEQFPYLNKDPSSGNTGWMPFMPITLTLGAQSVSVEGLIDSGAALNVLPWDLGLRLGFIWQQQTISMSLAGNLAASQARAVLVQATVGRFPPVSLAFAWTREKHVPLLLGQTNFFQEFDVCFFRSRMIFEVSLPSPPPSP